MPGWPTSQHPQESPGPLCSAHNPLSVWKAPLGTFPPLTGYDLVITINSGSVISVVQLPTYETTEGTIGVKLVHTSISVRNFQSNCVRARNTFFKLQFGMCFDELLADQLQTQFQ